MATFLDLSLFGYFGSIFIFLFVFAIMWGLLTFSKIFKSVPGEKGIYGLIALSIALIVMVSKDITLLLATMAPWFTVLMIFIFLLFLVFKMFSGEDNTQLSEAIRSPGVYWTIIILSVIILIASLSSTFGQQLLDGQNVPTSNLNDRNDLSDNNFQDVNVVDNVDTTDSSSSSSTSSTSLASSTSTATGDFNDNFLATLVNPKVMGLILMMFIAFFAILLLARTPDPD